MKKKKPSCVINREINDFPLVTLLITDYRNFPGFFIPWSVDMLREVNWALYPASCLSRPTDHQDPG